MRLSAGSDAVAHTVVLLRRLRTLLTEILKISGLTPGNHPFSEVSPDIA